MSRNLEKEYKALVGEETPQLWERIEAGIEAEIETEVKNKKPRFNYAVITIAAAACVCAAVSLPIIINNITGKISSDISVSMDSIAEDSGTAVFAALDEELLEEAANELEYSYTQEEILGWFNGEGTPDIIAGEEPVLSDDGAVYYMPVSDEGMYDLKPFLEQYFDEDKTSELLGTKINGYDAFIFEDGVLYWLIGLYGN